MKCIRYFLVALLIIHLDIHILALPAQLMIPPLPLPKQSHPDDVSFCIVDLKYKDDTLKICEFGQGAVSGFYGHQRLFGMGKIWANVWKFFSQLDLPFVLFWPDETKATKAPRYALESFTQYGGTMIHKSLPSLKPSTILTAIKPSYLVKNQSAILQQSPGIIIMDKATRPFVLNKVLTHIIFKDNPTLSALRPRCKILPKHYTKELTRSILQSMPADRYVIKPLDGYKGEGIVFADRTNLDTILKTVLTPYHLIKYQKRFQQEPFKYWQHDSNNFFIIESYEPSNPVTVNKKKYDATMRVALGLAYLNNTITVDFFGAYWKLPQKSLDDKGTLEQKYKSHIEAGTVCSAPVAEATYNNVKKILKTHMPAIYLKMIAASNDPYFTTFISQQLCPSDRHENNNVTNKFSPKFPTA